MTTIEQPGLQDGGVTTTDVQPTAVFFGGVLPSAPAETALAEHAGAALADAGFTLLHGGYNGLMEACASGAASRGGRIKALTLAGKHSEWGGFNPHVAEADYLPTAGARLDAYLDAAQVVVAMAGGVGSLHELTAAIYYSGNIRPVPVWLLGDAAIGLGRYLRAENWLVETPTRPLGFLSEVADAAEFTARLGELSASLGRAR